MFSGADPALRFLHSLQCDRLLLSARVNTHRSPRRKSMSPGHMVVRGAAVVCVHGTPYIYFSSFTSLTLIFVADSIVRAFLIEEAKVVKRVIKSQQKATTGRS